MARAPLGWRYQLWELAKPQRLDFTGTFNPIEDGEILAPDYN